MKKIPLSKKEIKKLNLKVEKYEYEFHKKDPVFKNEYDEYSEYELNDKIYFREIEDRIIPSFEILDIIKIKKIYIDKNAVKFLYSGADLMMPGVTSFEENIKKNEVILVALKEPFVPTEFAISLYSSEDLNNISKGKIAKNLKSRKLMQKEEN